MKHNIFKQLTMTAVGTFIVASGAMAVSPYAMDDYTVTAGVITDNNVGGCAIGFTCVDMDASDVGIMQRTITDDGTGVSYLQTVITESDATGVAASLNFSIEAYVFGAGNSSNNIAVQQRLDDAGMNFMVNITEGAFETGADIADANSSGDGVAIVMDQMIDMGGTDYSSFSQVGGGGGADQIIAQKMEQQGMDERFVVATQKNVAAGGTLGGLDIGAVSYLAGEDIRVVWVGEDAPNGQQFGFQSYENLDTGLKSTKVSSDGNILGIHDDNGPWDWDAIFGAAPTQP